MCDIETYISNCTLTEKTKKSYNKELALIKKLNNDTLMITPELFKTFINKSTYSDCRKRDLTSIYISFCKYHKRETSILKAFHLELCCIYTPIKNSFDSRDSLLETLNKSKAEKQELLLLNLLLKYPTLRCDLANIKIRDIQETDCYFKENVLYFSTLNKKANSSTKVNLEQSEIDLINSWCKGVYIFDINGDIKNRSSNFSKMVSRVSMKHLNCKLTVNCFRKICSRDNIEKVCVECNITPEQFLTVYKKLNQLELNNCHTLDTAVNHYF